MSESRPLMAVFGGTFDPFHKAHEWLCQTVLARSEVGLLRLMPCQTPALKSPAQADARDRLAMLEAWVETQHAKDRLVIDRRELDRSGPSYSVDTLTQLQQEFPDWRRVFVLGADAFESLPRWHGVDRLIQLTHFWVFGREGHSLEVPDLGLTQVNSLSELMFREAGCWLRGPSSHSDLASRELRAHRLAWREALPEPVYQYITRTGLYQSQE